MQAISAISFNHGNKLSPLDNFSRRIQKFANLYNENLRIQPNQKGCSNKQKQILVEEQRQKIFKTFQPRFFLASEKEQQRQEAEDLALLRGLELEKINVVPESDQEYQDLSAKAAEQSKDDED